jgi:glycosyltransferase involved in cell wall biosynthesis
MVGGDPTQIARGRAAVGALGIDHAVIFTGQRPSEEIPAYLDAADVLVSPRSTGTNTPLKIYQYLRSGRPIVATRLRTHTQVLSDAVSFLADPTPAAFAAAIARVIDNPAAAAAVGRRAQELAATRYSDDVFIDKTRQACGFLMADQRPEAAGGVA